MVLPCLATALESTMVQVQKIPFGRLGGLSDDGNVVMIVEPGSAANCVSVHFYRRGTQLWEFAQSLAVPTTSTICTKAAPLAAALSGNGQRALVLFWSSTMNQAVFLEETTTGWAHDQTVDLPVTGENKGANPWPTEVALSDDGTQALVGTSWLVKCIEPECASAYALLRSPGGWIVEHEFVKPQNDAFAVGLALSGDGETAFIAANSKIFSYTRGTAGWTETQTIPEPEPGDDHYDYFAHGLSLVDNGQVALAGEWNDHCPDDSYCGSAYIFGKTGQVWQQAQKILNPLPAPDPAFGWGVAISGNGGHALIAAPSANCAQGPNCGAAHSYRQNAGSWEYLGRIRALDEAASQQFGFRVALSAKGDVAGVGTYVEGVYLLREACDPDNPVLARHCFELPINPGFVMLGCEIVDCCPGCPRDEPIDWRIRFDGDPIDAIVLRFEGLLDDSARRLTIPDHAEWIGAGLLRVAGGRTTEIGGFPRHGKNLLWSQRSPRVTIHQVLRRKSGPDTPTVRMRVEQRIGDTEISETTLLIDPGQRTR